MKKIIAAAAVATMLAGAAFAEISFSYTGYNYLTGNGGNVKYETASRSDCMSLSISNEKAGAVVDMDLDNTGLVKDAYYAWMNFGLPAGNLQVTAGCWAGRYADRVKTDAGDLDAEDFEGFKMGVINGTVGKDSNNLTEKNISMVAAYTLPDVLPGTLMFKLGAVTSNWRQETKAATAETALKYDKTKTKIEEKYTLAKSAEDAWDVSKAGFVGEVAYRQKDLFNVNLSVKSLKQNQTSVALFFSPLMVEKLQATAGFTYAIASTHKTNSLTKPDLTKDAGKLAVIEAYQNGSCYWSRAHQEIAVDLRVRYAFTEAFSVTTMHNISANDNNDAFTNDMVMWNMVNASFKAAENVTFGCTVQDVVNNFARGQAFNVDTDETGKYTRKVDSLGNEIWNGNELTSLDVTVSPYCVVKVSDKAQVTTSVRAEWTNVNPKMGKENLKVTVPVLVSFSL